VMYGMMPSSSPHLYRPNASPMSQLIAMAMSSPPRLLVLDAIRALARARGALPVPPPGSAMADGPRVPEMPSPTQFNYSCHR
jgi:hypothetical protein